MLMGQSSDFIHLAYDFIDDFIYWKQPQKSIFLLKEALKLPVLVFITMYFLSLRYLLVAGIWIVALMHSPFFVSLFKITYAKVLSHLLLYL